MCASIAPANGLSASERGLPLAPYVEAIETAEKFRRHLGDIFSDVDLLLTPSAANEAPNGLGSAGGPRLEAV